MMSIRAFANWAQDPMVLFTSLNASRPCILISFKLSSNLRALLNQSLWLSRYTKNPKTAVKE